MQAEAILLVDAQQQRCPGGRQPVGLGQRLGLEAGAAQQRQHHIGQIEEDQGDGGQHGQATGQYRTPYQAILQGPPAPPPAQCRRVEVQPSGAARIGRGRGYRGYHGAEPNHVV